jgi:riboflavin biosynthesis pyrimidine reductase
MVQPVDDLLAAVRPHALGDDADLQMLLDLRSISDAVLIGTGTLRAEGYARLVRSEERRARRRAAGLAEDPVAVLISRRFDIPWEAGLFQAPEQPVLVYTAAAAPVPDVPAPVEVVALPSPSPTAVLADLRKRGVRALLCESGPTLNRALVAAGLVDELYLTLAPVRRSRRSSRAAGCRTSSSSSSCGCASRDRSCCCATSCRADDSAAPLRPTGLTSLTDQ